MDALLEMSKQRSDLLQQAGEPASMQEILPNPLPFVQTWSNPSQQGPTTMDRLMQFLPALMASRSGGGGGGGGTAGGYTGTGTPGDPGNVLMPGDPSLISRRGATLQDFAMDSLLQAVRQYDLMPKGRELGLFGPGSTYRTPQQQADIYARKPGVAAPPGRSLHQRGLAVDLPSQLQTQAFFNILRGLGWSQLAGEPWHWSAPGYYG